MMVDERILKFRQAIWVFTDKILPKLPLVLQPSLADIAWLMTNHFFSPEDSQKLYIKIREIWHNRSFESNYYVELLAQCAWKIKLFLTYNQQESAFKLFQQITKAVRSKNYDLSSNFEIICLPTTKAFTLPKIPDEDINFLSGLARACQETKGNLTIKYIADMIHLSQKETVSFLHKLDVLLNSMVAHEALGLYWIRAEVDIDSSKDYRQLLEKFKPFVNRCEVHTPLSNTLKSSESRLSRLSIEFLYPIDYKNTLFKWAVKNGVRLYRQLEQRIYQNFNVLYQDQWHPLAISRLKSKGFEFSIVNSVNRIDISKQILQIIEIYLKRAFYFDSRDPNSVDCLLPFFKLGNYLKIREAKAQQMAVGLFHKRILVPYFYSNLIIYIPEKVLEGAEFPLYDKARGYLYARGEILQLFNDKDQRWEKKIYRLYVPEVTPMLLEYYESRVVKRVYWEPPLPLIQTKKYNFNKSCWKRPELPNLWKLL